MRGIVGIAIESGEYDSQARLWIRDDDGLRETTKPFRPWFLSAFRGTNYRGHELEGDNELRWLQTFATDEEFEKGLAPHIYPKTLVWTDKRQQFLAQNPECHLFQDMDLSDLCRLQLDIETTGLNPDKDHLLCVGLKCGDMTHVIANESEETMLEELTEIILALDPDTIEGHNIFGFDLPFLMKRAALHDVDLVWGRNDTVLNAEPKPRNFRIGSYEQPITVIHCSGRHTIDSMLIAGRYDSNTGGRFASFGLKAIAEDMGVSCPDRVIIPRGEMAEYFEKNPELVREYVLQDVTETEAILTQMIEPEFYLTSLLPDTFQGVCTSGGGTKVNQLMIEKYLHANHSIPIAPKERPDYEGGAVECRETGLFRGVVKDDVASMYPTIMLSDPQAVPEKDTLKIFHKTLQSLTEKRLTIKGEKKKEKDRSRQRFLNGADKAYKVLINSFYGYLGCGMNFSDFDAAATVTAQGRRTVIGMALQAEAAGYTVIEVDTDGVYYQLDESGEPMPRYRLDMPVSIETEHYDAMLSVKAKNYVLAKDGRLYYHGNSLRSRRDERFGRELIERIVELLFEGNNHHIQSVFEECKHKILSGKIPHYMLARRERVSEKTMTSPMKKRLKDALDDGDTVGDYIEVYQREDGSLAKIEEFSNDYDRYYYWMRLWKFADRLNPVLSDLGIQFEKPSKKAYKLLAA